MSGLVGINHVALEVGDLDEALGLDFRDPWGNHVQLVEYAWIQLTKTPAGRRKGLGG
ncbi:MAG: hypothetical protein JW895_16030 [Thermoleophilaceae bacterium]|nr:hypothetical protein [Thermoleophilaceae bacterium]